MEQNGTPEPVREPHIFKTPVILIFITIAVFVTMAIFGVLVKNNQQFKTVGNFGFAQFKDEQEFKQYLSTSQSVINAYSLGGTLSRDLALPEGSSLGAPVANTFAGTGGGTATRVSQTNVQVSGVDEPDVIKTDGSNIYYSPNGSVYYYGGAVPLSAPSVMESGTTSGSTSIMPPVKYQKPQTKIISALPANNPATASEIDKTGNLLVSGNILIVFEYNQITGFDIENPKAPTQVWQYKYDENFRLQTARLYGGEVYLVTSRYADASINCPVPLMSGASNLTIACAQIYRPTIPVDVNTLYSTVALNPQTGAVDKSVSFVGSQSSGVVYMSTNSIYTTYTTFPNPLNFMARFFSEHQDLISPEALGKIDNLQGYDISDESKLNELRVIIQKYMSQFSSDERAKKQSDIQNAMSTYLKEHGRELQKTAIVKLTRNTFDVTAIGEIPGAPLNQFSLDEYNGNLRVATTISASTMFGTGDTANDVYVLDNDMHTVGQIQDLALGERIYSARFIKDRGYLVTFKQVDPFFVLDLTNPASPSVAGQLKIPGYSSYLHELAPNKILGVGKEGNQTKLSVFDVTDPNNPIESDKYMLSEYYSEVANNHHAFLQDPDHSVFFLPAGGSGYIFSYNNGLKLERVVTGINANRAVYINNNLYVVGQNKMVVVNEDNWQNVSELEY